MSEENLLHQSVVRILDTNGTFHGSGFLIDPLLVVTCAHVVKDANSDRNQPIQVKFYDDEQQTGIVTNEGWSEPSSEGKFEPYHYDIAFIRLQKPPATAVSLRLHRLQWSTGEKYISFYYRKLAEIPSHARGEILGLLPIGKRQAAILEVQDDMERGSSGAPIMAQNGVIGMVIGSLSRERAHARAINAEVIQECWSQLEPVINTDKPAPSGVLPAPPPAHDPQGPTRAALAAGILAMIAGCFLFQWGAYSFVTLFRGLSEAARIDLYSYLLASLCLLWGTLIGALLWNSQVRSKIMGWFYKGR